MSFPEVCGWLATALFALCYVPQMWKTWKTKTVEDVSIGQWVLQLIGYCSGLVYGLYLGQAILICGYIWGFICSILYITLYFRAKKFTFIRFTK